ncbi:MAG: hypothetical protein MR010_05975 [Lachnospiraceae bacterium]|nr:hypothetical protein [Lachnospiraceae bacterium]
MSRIKGVSVKLYERQQTGEDEFKHPIYEETAIEIKNVLISPSSSNEIVEQLNLNGKKAEYTLAIPKEDNHSWEDRTVEFFGEKWHTIGFPTEGIESMLPLDWNKKVMVERYG